MVRFCLSRKCLILKSFLLFLVLLVFLGCGKEVAKEEEKPNIVIQTEPPLPDKITWEKDGKAMVLIRAGSFEMGDHFNEGLEDELPIHYVKIDSFYMDVHEVTVGQFREFVNQGGIAMVVIGMR